VRVAAIGRREDPHARPRCGSIQPGPPAPPV